MNDTPAHIRDMQLKLWLAKTPEERLLQFITENDAWWKAIREAKEKMKQEPKQAEKKTEA
jgi:hypothetical protein